MRRRRTRALAVAVLTAIPFLGITAAHADDTVFTWTGKGQTANWSDGGNWAGGTAPVAGPQNVDLVMTGTSVDDIDSLGIGTLSLAGTGTIGVRDGGISPDFVADVEVADQSSWTVDPDLDLDGADADDATEVNYAGTGTVTFTGLLSDNGLETNGAGGTTILAGLGSNSNRFVRAETGLVELDKPDGVQATGGGVTAGNFSKGTVRWLASNQLGSANEPTIGTLGADGLLDLNGHDEEVFSVQSADGTLKTGAGTLTVDRSISNNNVAGTISGHLSFPGNAGAHQITDEAGDNRLDISASISGDADAVIEVQDAGTLNLTGGGDFAGTLELDGSFGGTTDLTNLSADLSNANVVFAGGDNPPTLALSAAVATITGSVGTLALTTASPGHLVGTAASDVSGIDLAPVTGTGPLLTVASGPLEKAFANAPQGAAEGNAFLDYCDGAGRTDVGLDASPPQGCMGAGPVTLAAGTIVYSRHNSHGQPDAVWSLAPDGTDSLLEPDARDPRLSTDGATLYFRRGTEADGYADHLWARVLATGAETDLYATTSTVVGYDAFQNSGLVFDQACSLEVLGTAGGTPTALTGSACGDVAPAENRAGTRLAVQDANGILAAATDGTKTRGLVAGTLPGDSSPSWSPDGKTLAFLRIQPGTTTRADVWTVPAAGGTATRLTTLADRDALGPALPWSGDGSAVISAGRIYGVFGLWRIPTAGGAPELLPVTAGDPVTYVGAVVGDSVPAGSVAKPAPAATTTTLASPGAAPGQPLALTATVRAGGALPRGTVTFSEGATQLGTATLDSTATATLTLQSGLPAGTHSLTATYAGGDVFAGSSGSLALGIVAAAHAVAAPKVWTTDGTRAFAAISCPSTSLCTGTVTLTATSRRHAIVIGTATFRLAHGGRGVVAVRLNKVGRRLLKNRARVRVALVLRQRRKTLRLSRSLVFTRVRAA